MKKERKRKWEN